MQQQINGTRIARSIRAMLVIVALLLGLMAGLRPAFASCGGTTTVSTEAELTAAIVDYNGQAGPCDFTIAFDDDITLTDDLLIIGNTTAGVELTIDGAGFTLDADFSAAFHAEGGVLTVEDLTIRGAAIEAIFADSQVTLRVERVYVTGGLTGIYLLDSQGVITDSTIADNINGIQHYRSNAQPTPQLLKVINSTIAGNDDGIDAGANNLTMTNSTVTGSESGVLALNAAVNINNSILAGNDENCFQDGTTIDFNFSLLDSTDDACGAADGVDGNIVGDDPLLLPLGDYGGPTPTMQPVALSGGVTATSPVLDAGDNDLAVDENGDDLAFDQRGAGFPRVVNTTVDMGAVEGAFELECPTFPITVVDEAELNEAILCYNYITTAAVYTIAIDADIDLTASTRAIDNDTAGVSLVIEGNGNTIDGQDTPGVRPLAVEAETNVTLNDATLTGGDVAGLNLNDGGGIYNEGDLTLNNVIVTGNRSDDDGGGIFNVEGATLALINNSIISENLAGEPNGDSGGIANLGQMTITDSAITGNTAESDFGTFGGGIRNQGVMTIVRSTVSGNTINVGEESGAGGGIANHANLIIRDSTISGNTINGGSDLFGGGVYSDADPFDEEDVVQLVIINSTISGNGLDGGNIVYGGGLYAADFSFACCFDDPVPVTLINTTLAGNSLAATDSDFAGGGAYFEIEDPDNAGLAVTIHNSILADSTTDGAAGGDCARETDVTFASLHSLYEATGDGACGLAAADPDADGNIVGVDPALGPLQNNGGPTETHLLGGSSAAVNTGDNDLADDENGDPLTADQRGAGFPRIVNGTVDMGAVEIESTSIFMSTTAAGTTGDGLAFGPEDVIEWDGSEWTTWFDGSAAGLTPMNAKHNINAFYIPDPDGNDLLLSFAQNRRFVPGITQPVDGMDLVMWGGDDFSFYFDGSDVGLTNKTQEKIDALHMLDGSESPINGGACLFYLLISTAGPGKVPNHSGGTLNFSGEDVLGFCMTGGGENTTGLWHKFLDGSDQGMPKNATDSISVSADGETLYLTTKGTFNVDGAVGGHSMVYAYDISGQTFSGPTFIAADNGLPKKVDGLQVE